MGELFFSQLTSSLKSMENVKSDERFFEGLLTVQMKDKQGEVTIVDELYKVLPIWMDRGAPISDTHSNRIIGKGINYSRTVVKNEHGEELPAIKITGKIFKNYELDNVIWDKIKSKEYRGLSFGGATRSNRTPMRMKDGSTAFALSDLEHYEVAVCKDPAVPMALITDFNPIAKASFNSFDRGDGKMVIQCSNMGCYIDKKFVDPNPEEEDPEKIMQSAEAVGRGGYDMYKAIEELEKTDLTQYDTFEGKVQALIKEGYTEEQAKRIVGAFVKGEKKKDGDGGTMTTSTEGVNNPTYGGEEKKHKKEDEDKKEDEEEEDNKDHSNTGGDTHNMYNQNSPSKYSTKTDTTVNQNGGDRNSIDRTFKQGGLEEEETNEIKRKSTDYLKKLNDSLYWHNKITTLKKNRMSF